ncbi:MAG TPA: pullulanase-associated domain-containing protein [Anaeromyxobacter sp.]|nr:pullulanase-associated domain-containing protein [Anaeromyxobacter sp.]
MRWLHRMIVPASVAFALLAQPGAAEDLKLPDGKVAIHYFRAKGDYESWGVHVWESFQKPEEAAKDLAEKQRADRPLSSWAKAIAPSGKDDFGVYFLLDASEFGNGRVNYIIHRGDSKDQCNLDKYFMIADTKEVWVNAGDCNTYKTKDEALKARK